MTEAEIIALQTQHILARRYDMVGHLEIRHSAYPGSHHFTPVLDEIIIGLAEYRSSVIGLWITREIVQSISLRMPNVFLSLPAMLPYLAEKLGAFTIQTLEQYQNMLQMRVVPTQYTEFVKRRADLNCFLDFRTFPPKDYIYFSINTDERLWRGR